MAFAPALAIGSAVVGAASSAAQASSQNRQVRRAMQSEQRAAALQTAEAARQAEIDRQARIQEARKIQSLVQVSAAERGIGVGGSVRAIQQSNDYQAALNQYNADRALQYENERIIAGYQSNIQSIRARSTNGLLAMIAGGAQGFSTGLNISGNIDAATRPVPEFDQPTFDRLWIQTSSNT